MVEDGLVSIAPLSGIGSGPCAVVAWHPCSVLVIMSCSCLLRAPVHFRDDNRLAGYHRHRVAERVDGNSVIMRII